MLSSALMYTTDYNRKFSRVFRCAVQPSQHPAFSPGVSLTDAGYSTGTESPGVRERHSDWKPASLCPHLQSVLNAAAGSVADLRRSDHITETSCARLSAYNSSWQC